MTQSWVIQIACYSRELAGWFWRLVHEWKVQSRGVHRDFHGSARDSLASETSSRKKHLTKIFKSFGLKCFGGWPWRLISVAKNTCFAFQRQFLKTFSVFPSNFCDCSLSSPFLSQLKLTRTLLKLHFFIITSQDLQEKGMGFLCLTWFFMFRVLFSWFLSCHCV